MLIIFWFLAI